MPITAYSIEAKRELDLEQWLALNDYQPKDDPELLGMPSALREKAATDIECSCCGTRGAQLVRVAHSKGGGKAIAQGHFRFRTDAGTNPHHPLCDFYDEKERRNRGYQINLADSRSGLTRAIRDLVCRGITSALFSQADMHSMRLWFHEEKTTHTVKLDVTRELLQWCVEMQAAQQAWKWDFGGVPFTPEHGLLPGFDWDLAAKREWARRNEILFAEIDRGIWFRRQSIERPMELIAKYAGQLVLDPSELHKKYEAAVSLSRFAAAYLFGPNEKPPAIVNKPPSDWGAPGNALLALSALLLFLRNWDIDRASALYCQLKNTTPVPDGLEGNLIGLNPFHDYPAWQIINAARRIKAKRTDDRPMSEQILEVKTEIHAQHCSWVKRQ